MALKSLGFIVIPATDLTKQGMDTAFADFAELMDGADVALFYYAGHAMQYEGANYLLPIDAELKDATGLRYETAKLGNVIDDMSRVDGVRIVVLDACRNDPLGDDLKRREALTRGGETTRGLAPIAHPKGLLVVYSTQAGQVAEDGTGRRNSPFTTAFLKNSLYLG